MKRIMVGSIAIGDARQEGRQPSHDGEYLSVYYVPGGRDYIVESNAGVAWTSEGEDDALGECAMNEGGAVVRELEEQIAEARAIATVARGELARTMGAEARSAAIAWGWATEEDFEGDHIIPPYQGWTISYTQAELDLFGDGDAEGAGVDRKASAHRYCEALREALHAEFPGATVKVNLAENTTGGVNPWIIEPPADMDLEDEYRALQEVTLAAEHVTEKLWEDGRWYVDRLYSQTEFAEALAEAFPGETWTGQMIGSYRTRGLADFPEPRQYVGKHPAWTWGQVQEYIASRRKRETHSGIRPADSAYDRDCARATAALLEAFRGGGIGVETPVTGSVIIDGIEVSADRFEVLSWQWARREFEGIDNLVEYLRQAAAEKAERAEADRVEAARDSAEEEGGI